MSFQELLNDLVVTIQSGTTPNECSRIDMMADEDGIMLLLRTQPQLSERMLAASPYQYPHTLVLNNRIMLHVLTRYIQNGAIMPAISELTRIAMVATPHEYGIDVDEEMGIISVPQVKRDKDLLVDAARWSQFLADDPHVNPAFSWQLHGVEFFFVHLPDVAVSNLSSNQMLHIARLTRGWNYSDFENLKYMKTIARLIRTAATHATTIIDYSS